ncbi:EKC/KEOPS complex subunit TPRKB isoform X1 [Neoarius graeffei]|uniref:EKC/KEOPS complex subunit TPRKB isoform X1 n=1 Tax=Neoarius graeffei TaxID=443677 RepID=UPI00298C8007|nr:EKC/KEOPS complex subunit TPRKB isoform X1 [Neoarius graeffei]
MVEYSVWTKYRMSGAAILFLNWILLPSRPYVEEANERRTERTTESQIVSKQSATRSAFKKRKHRRVLDPFQTVLAANKAVHVQKIGKMKTRSLYSEIIFNLSPTNNISEAFKRFGISDNDHAVLIVLVHNKEDANNKDDLLSKVDGQQIPADQISTLSDLAKIKKLYKVAPQEEKCGSILDAVICRMAAKDVI